MTTVDVYVLVATCFYFQDQLRNQIDVVDQERNRVKRLRKERDIHEASALGARTKERNLERELEQDKAVREMEVGNLKDMLEHEIALKRNLEEVLSARNSEFETVSQELQYFKDDRKITIAINKVKISGPIILVACYSSPIRLNVNTR
jgi:HPt (histidine-containing phosphotransfer) domain-containing protein